MFRIRIIKLFVAVALLVAVTGGSGIVADQFGLDVTGQAHACASSGGSGGGC